jgi:hypothetical protein
VGGGGGGGGVRFFSHAQTGREAPILVAEKTLAAISFSGGAKRGAKVSVTDFAVLFWR